MNNETENKLVITSGADSGKEYYLLKGSTTVGSAPDNDVHLNDQAVSGFHAEVRCQNDSFLIFDFNSAKGTFVNKERIASKKALTAGDRIQIGSTHAVFIPLNAAVAKECGTIRNLQKIFKRIEPYYTKWADKKNKKVLACVLPLIVVLMMAMALSRNNGERQGENTGQGSRTAQSADTSEKSNGADKEATDSKRNKALPNGDGSLLYMPNGAVVAAAGAIRNQPHPRPQDRFADIYFNIANTFADYQLWQIALEYYQRVFEKKPGYPELAAQIAKMKAEKQNQIFYEEGRSAMKSARYQKGITDLLHIPENSHYFQVAAQIITEAEEKISKENTSNE